MHADTRAALRQTSGQRDYLFDNYKAFLITLVVIGHFIEPACAGNEFLDTLKWFIVSFHMPAFIFISGYFSKRVLSGADLIRKLAVPYFIYEIVYYLFYTFLMHRETKLYLLYPKFTLWYLLALFVWRAATPYVKRIPHYLPLSLAAGLLAGFWPGPSNFFSLPRILFFYPFFLVGTEFTRETVSAWRTEKTRAAAAAGVTGLALVLIFGPVRSMYSSKIFYGRYSYESLSQGALEGLLCRAVCYAVGFLMTFAFLLLMSEQQNRCSCIGTRTMAIYLFHGLTCAYLKGCTEILKNTDTLPESLALLAFCVLLVAVFSIPQLSAFTNRIASLHLPQKRMRPGWKPGYSVRWTMSHLHV